MTHISYRRTYSDHDTAARCGELTTAHATFPTPVFMPVGTVGSVKGIYPWDVEATGSRILLANTYHLMLRPGMEVMGRMRGLHKLMGWPHAILTDSGGYQVFSLARLREITEEGVSFQSHIDGSRHTLTPESAVGIQETIGSDIMMVLDECPPPDADEQYAARSMAMTTRWAKRCLAARSTENGLFGIVQGGMHAHLRQEHAAELAELPFDGLAVGGLSVGESKEVMDEMLAASMSRLPADRPRYFMGVGKPGDILRAVAQGIDMFDCVLPTRSGRTGLLFTRQGEMNIKNARYRFDEAPIDSECGCPVCQRFSRAYLRHLYVSGEMLGPVLNTLHNLTFYQDLMQDIRAAIAAGEFGAYLADHHDRLSGKV